MSLRVFVFTLILTVGMVAGGTATMVIAQEPTPSTTEDTVEIPYGMHPIEITPSDGPIQCIIVRRTDNTVSDLDGAKTKSTVYAALIYHDVDLGWKLAGTVEWPAKGVWDLQAEDSCNGLGGS